MAHKNDDGSIQTLREHLQQTANLAYKLAPGNLKNIAYLLGLLHDIGKYQPEFQSHIQKQDHNKVDHSSMANAILINYFEQVNDDMSRLCIEAFGGIIMAHHVGYLPNFGNELLQETDYEKRSKRFDFESVNDCYLSFLKDNNMSENQVENLFQKAKQQYIDYIKSHSNNVYVMYWTERLLLSILINADHSDTSGIIPTASYAKWIHSKYNILLNNLETKSIETNVDKVRQIISSQCDEAANSIQPNIRTLAAQTGLGKTFASLRWGLKTCMMTDQKQIIIVVPLLSVIEQNVKEIRNILNVDSSDLTVIEDDSNTNHHTLDDYELNNWDAPIIITTTVNFLKVCFGSGTSHVQHFSNIANAVVIFDEVQAIPTKSLDLFSILLDWFNSFSTSKVLLSSATLPDFRVLLPTLKVSDRASLVSKRIKISPRYEIKYHMDHVVDPEDIVKFASERAKTGTVLIIVNTKSLANEIYNKLDFNNKKLITTDICHAERLDNLADIADLLKKDKPVICVSTQIMQAGVDLSFDYLIRDLAGLDSIIQSAGRCNRNGNKHLGCVDVFNISEDLNKLPEINASRQAMLEIDDKNDVNKYFKKYFGLINTKFYITLSNGKTSILQDLINSTNINYSLGKEIHSQLYGTVARNYEPIDNEAKYTILIQCKGRGEDEDKGVRIVNELMDAYNNNDPKMIKKMTQLAQDYMVKKYNKPDRHEYKEVVPNELYCKISKDSLIF